MILPRIKNSRVSSVLPPLLPATASVVGYERRGREKKKGKEEEKRRDQRRRGALNAALLRFTGEKPVASSQPAREGSKQSEGGFRFT